MPTRNAAVGIPVAIMVEDNERIDSKQRIAVLIDGDNAQPSLLDKMVEEVAKHGTPTVRRVYGDWTTPQMQSWKQILHEHAFQPVQQFRYVSDKNSTDSAMIIDAMDILYSENVDAFCLISSDSDYTRLATRLREEGKFVMGIGEKKTPKPLLRACNLFVYTENLTDTGKKRARASGGQSQDRELRDLLNRAFGMVEEEDGWTELGRLGDSLRQIDPGFDPRTYGHKKLLDMIQEMDDIFEVKRERDRGPSPVYIRSRD